jgi:hypothetical protein
MENEADAAVKAVPGLQSLRLSDTYMGSEGIAALTGLHSLTMRSAAILTELAAAQPKLTGLRSLNLGFSGGFRWGCTDSGADAALARLAAALPALTELRSLSLGLGLGPWWCCETADAALAGLAAGLAALTGLTSLDLGDNDLRWQGKQALTGLSGLTSRSAGPLSFPTNEPFLFMSPFLS